MDAIIAEISKKYRRREELTFSSKEQFDENLEEENVGETYKWITSSDLRLVLDEERKKLIALKNKDIQSETLKSAQTAIEILSASAARSKNAGFQAAVLESSDKVVAGSMRAEKKTKRLKLETSLKLVQRWRSAWELGERVAHGDEVALRELERRANTLPELMSVVERASLLLREKARAELEAATQAVQWPVGSNNDWLSTDVESQNTQRLLRAIDRAFKAKKGYESQPFQVLEAGIIARFEFFFLKATVASEPSVAARWLIRVYRECRSLLLGPNSSLLDDDDDDFIDDDDLNISSSSSARAAARCIRRCVLKLARRHLSSTLPFENAHQADSFVQAYRELERSMGVRSGGPVALIAENCLGVWLASDAMAIKQFIFETLDDVSTEEKLINNLCPEPRPGHLEAPIFTKRSEQRSYELVSGILRYLDRVATLEFFQRRQATQNILDTAISELRNWTGPRLRRFGLDELVAIVGDHLAARLLNRISDAWQSWFAACTAVRLLFDLSHKLLDQWPGFYEDENIITALKIANPLPDDVIAFAERLAQLAAAGSAQPNLGTRNGFWIRAFLTEINQRLPEAASRKARTKLADLKLADLLTASRADDTRLSSKTKILAEAFVHHDSSLSLRFDEVATLASLEPTKRRSLIRAFEALCLEGDEGELFVDSDPRTRKRRLLALDAALSRDSVGTGEDAIEKRFLIC